MRTDDIALSKSVFKGALILSAGGIIAKVAGALYRIPLTNILGTQGMGLYQMIFPLYSILLAVSGAGIPVALSRIISEKLKKGDESGARSIFLTAYITISIAGLVCSLLLYFCSGFVASFQGNILAAQGYKMIAPSVFFVSQTAVLRGYFQGRSNMFPTALSLIIEQAAKIVFVFGVALSFLPDINKAVSYSVLAVTVSEFAALILLLIIYAKHKNKYFTKIKTKHLSGTLSRMGIIAAAALPLTISSIIFPLSAMIDSAMILKTLSQYFGNAAVSLYGLFSGPVNSLIAFPVMVTSAVAVSSVPAITRARVENNAAQLWQKTEFALKLTLLIALPSACGLYIFSQPVINLLYPSLSAHETATAVLLLKISSASVVFLSVMQTAVSVLIALKKAFITSFNLIIAVMLKISLAAVLLKNPSINIYGSAISAVLCYFTAAMLNMLYLKYNIKTPISLGVYIRPLICCVITISFSVATFFAVSNFTSENIALLCAIAVCVPVLMLSTLKTGVFSPAEIKSINILKRKTA